MIIHFDATTCSVPLSASYTAQYRTLFSVHSSYWGNRKLMTFRMCCFTLFTFLKYKVHTVLHRQQVFFNSENLYETGTAMWEIFYRVWIYSFYFRMKNIFLKGMIWVGGFCFITTLARLFNVKICLFYSESIGKYWSFISHKHHLGIGKYWLFIFEFVFIYLVSIPFWRESYWRCSQYILVPISRAMKCTLLHFLNNIIM